MLLIGHGNAQMLNRRFDNLHCVLRKARDFERNKLILAFYFFEILNRFQLVIFILDFYSRIFPVKIGF